MNILAGIGAGTLAHSFIWKKWMKELGITEEKIKKRDGGTVTMLISLGFKVIVSFLVIYTISQEQLPVFMAGLLISSIAVFSALKNYLFEKNH